MSDRIKFSVVAGLLLATVYAAFSIVVYIAGGGNSNASEGVNLPTVIATYYVAGAIGGLLVGALLPIAKHFLGAVAIGFTGAFVAFFCITVATNGPVWEWSAAVVQKLLILTCVFGAVGTIVVVRNR